MGLHEEMYEACIDALDPGERSQLSTELFNKLISTCSQVASTWRSSTMVSVDESVPALPALFLVRATLLVQGDWIWYPDLVDFIQIADVQAGSPTGIINEHVSVTYVDGRQELLHHTASAWIAIIREDARRWHAIRPTLDDETLHRITDAHPR